MVSRVACFTVGTGGDLAQRITAQAKKNEGKPDNQKEYFDEE